MESVFTFLLRNEEAFIHTFAPHHHEFQAASGREYVGCPVSIISFYKHYGTLTVSVGVRIHTLYGGSIGHWRAWRGLMILHASITWSRSRFSFAIAVVCGRCHGSLFLRRCSLSLSCQYLSPYIHRPPSPMDNLYPQTRSRPPLVGYILSMSISYRNPTTSQQLRPQLRLCLIPPELSYVKNEAQAGTARSREEERGCRGVIDASFIQISVGQNSQPTEPQTAISTMACVFVCRIRQRRNSMVIRALLSGTGKSVVGGIER